LATTTRRACGNLVAGQSELRTARQVQTNDLARLELASFAIYIAELHRMNRPI
jgi:hypothetical protein